MADEPAGGLPRIVLRLRQEGIGWIAKRLAAETANPTTRPGRFLHALARRAISSAAEYPRLLRRLRAPQFANSDALLYAFYDLAVAPVTFDFLWFLVAADLHRRRRGLNDIHVVIVPGRHGGLRRERTDYEAIVTLPARQERILNILFESCRLLPGCAGITQAASRAEAQALRSLARHAFPSDYDTRLPSFPHSRMCLDAARRGDHPIAVLRASDERKANIERWLVGHGIGSRRLVSITLRDYGYMPQRNSNLTAWASFARGLDPARFFPVIIPDTDETMAGQPAALAGLTVFAEAAWNVGLRMALYERAYLNMGVNTGPMGLCWLNELTRYATLKMAPSGVPQTSLEYFGTLGFEPGQSLPFAAPFQELVWEDDTLDGISRAFARLSARIEKLRQR